MRVSRLWAYLSVLAVTCASPGLAAPKPSEIVPLYISANRPLMMLTIGDSGPFPVVFDTGSDENLLDSTLAKRAGLKVIGRFNLVDDTNGKSQVVPVVATPDARISGVPLNIKKVNLLDYRSGDEVGIFSPYSFGDRYVVIEPDRSRLRLVPKGSGFVPPGPGHAFVDNVPGAAVRIAGKPYDAVLDTGNSSVLDVGADLVESTPLDAPAKIVGKAISAMGEREVVGGDLAGSLDVGPYSVKGPAVAFSMPGKVVDVGFEVIRHLTIVVDPANKRTWILDPASERSAWASFAGRYGPRSIRLEGGRLIHQRDGRPPYELTYLGADLFEMETGDRIQFFRENGRVIRLELITAQNRVSQAERTP